MAILILILILLGFFHLIYEGAFAPSIRLSYRFRLFALRDALRMQKCVQKNRLSDDVYDDLEESINNTIHYMPRLDFGFLSAAMKVTASNPQYKENVKKRRELLERCPVDEVQKIRKEIIKITSSIFAVNMGAWVIYLIPVIIFLVGYESFKLMVKNFAYLPEKDMNNVVANAKFRELSPDLSYA